MAADEADPTGDTAADTVMPSTVRAGELDASADLGSMASLLGALAATPAIGPLARGAIVDEQYRVERVLGEGGMGVVYLARDLRLDREVAIKVGLERSAAALARVGREAIALARLSHPNVVVIHQVGEIGGRVFVAMEHVAGGTLRAWLDAKPRTWREIVAIFAAAGDGLAAAHAAGIVHRDFKPDNVLVGADGRPRVADFGLARAFAEPAPVDEAAITDAAAAPALASMTQTGAVVGTPAYMPPEQLAGDDVDARADQFAFCAALWEALFGQRPYAGKTPAQLRTSIESQEPRRPDGATRARGLPRHIELALRRGLRPDRDARWPSLAPLLVELRRDPARQRARVAAVAAAIVVGGGAATVALTVGRDRGDPCGGGEARIGATWGPTQVQRVRATFAGLGHTWTARAADHAVTALDDWSRRWAVQYRSVCEAHDAAWSTDLHDRGMQCLARRGHDLAAVAAVLAVADLRTAARVDRIVDGMPPLDECSDPVYLAHTVAPPTDPAIARAVDAGHRALAFANVIGDAGRYWLAEALFAPIIADGLALGAPALTSDAERHYGWVLVQRDDTDHAIDVLRSSYFRARAAFDDDLGAAAAADVSSAMITRRKVEETRDWAQLALADSSRAEATGEVTQNALTSLSFAALESHDFPAALGYADRVVELARASGLPLRISDAYANRSRVHTEAGDYGLAIKDLEASRDLARGWVGADHPRMMMVVSDLGFAYHQSGRYDEAIAAAREVIALGEANPGKDTQQIVADAYNLLGGALTGAKDEDARVALDHAVELEVATQGPNGPDVASALNNRGMVLRRLHRYDEAAADLRRAIAISSSPDVDDLITVASAYGSLADILDDAGQLRDAEAAARTSIETWTKAAPDSPDSAYAYSSLGKILLDGGDLRGARAALLHAMALRDRPDAPDGPRAYTRWLLAQVLVKSGDVEGARTELTQALEVYRANQDSHTADVEALLRSLPASPRPPR